MKDWLKVEAVLFGSGKYLTEDEISKLSGVASKNLKHALSELKKHYSNIESSLDVFNEGNSWKLNVREDFAHIVKNVISEAEMPKAIMETLALIAYKSPVLQSEIIDSRGTGAYDHIALLEDKGFISREKSGRSFKLRTAPKFFDYFDVDGDSKLRAMFKNVKKPETLGNLEVYTEAKTEEEKEVEFSDKILERMKKVETTPSDHEEKEKFLTSFEDKYSKTKNAIDETDTEMNEFRRIAPHDAPSESNDDSENILKKFDSEINKLEEVEHQTNDANSSDEEIEQSAASEESADIDEEKTAEKETTEAVKKHKLAGKSSQTKTKSGSSQKKNSKK